MEAHSDAENYWNRSVRKAFSFDEEEGEAAQFKGYEFGSCILDDDNISEASFENTLNTLNFTIRAVISETDVETILNEQLLEDSITQKGMAPDEELKLLRRKLQNVTHEPALNVTASILLQGKLCSLEVYRSLYDKEKLLDEVLQKGNGDGVISVILFLHKTLNKKQFYRILRRHVKACDHYVNYLIQTKNKEAIETLTIFGRYQEAALFRFKAAVSQSDVTIKKQRLQQLIVSYDLDSGMVSIFDQIFNNALKLIQLIENAKENLSDNIDSSSTSLEVLYSCCSNYKWKNANTNELLSPFKIASDHQISSAQFEWTALNERANSQSLFELSSIFEKSSWHSITKQFHISISLETAIQRLSDLRAPLQVLYMFLSKISNPNQKLIISKRVCCTKAVVDALASLKDVQELELLRDTLVKGSEEWFYCEQVLRNIKKKWSKDGLKIIL